MMVPPVQLQQPASPELVGAPELGRTSELGRASELGGARQLELHLLGSRVDEELRRTKA